MQLDLDKEDEFEAIHPDTGTPFTLKPISPREYEKLQRDAGKTRERDADPIKFAGLYAEAAIVAWHKDSAAGRVGVKQECTPENRRRFGEKFAFNILPWIVIQCMDAARSMEVETAEAKKG
ncbi:MAG: hypothetical protein ABIK08_11400 [Pseudomonadota bacterium]